jgi:hypothetical protein
MYVAGTEDTPTNSGSQSCLRLVPTWKNTMLGPRMTLRLAPCNQSFE